MKPAVPCYYHLDVEVSPERVGQVKRILGAHLRYWNLDTLVDSVCHCAEALLDTIDRHATDKNTTIEMWWNGSHLITAVSDNDQDLRPHNEPQGCLAQIAALSDGWGCCATGAAWARSSGSPGGPAPPSMLRWSRPRPCPACARRAGRRVRWLCRNRRSRCPVMTRRP